MVDQVEYYVGLAWASELHAVCVLDSAGKIVASFPVEHSTEGIAALITRLARYPTTVSARHLGQTRMAAFLVKPGYSAELLAQPRRAPTKDIDRSVAAQLGEHPDGLGFTSLPRSSAALAGVTPVTNQSGKHRAVHLRRACNKRFRQAINTYADNSRHASQWAAKIYNNARAAGKGPHAVRVLGAIKINHPTAA